MSCITRRAALAGRLTGLMIRVSRYDGLMQASQAKEREHLRIIKSLEASHCSAAEQLESARVGDRGRAERHDNGNMLVVGCFLRASAYPVEAAAFSCSCDRSSGFR